MPDFYCPTKNEEFETKDPLPAMEICPVCERAIGSGFGQCNVSQINKELPPGEAFASA